MIPVFTRCIICTVFDGEEINLSKNLFIANF